MNQILIVESSPRGAESASRKLTRKLRERLEVQYPEAKVVVRDLAKNILPHLDHPTLKAITTKDPAEAESLKEALACSPTFDTPKVNGCPILRVLCEGWEKRIQSRHPFRFDFAVGRSVVSHPSAIKLRKDGAPGTRR
jgi:FMN-dependent NADH-azoreductase